MAFCLCRFSCAQQFDLLIANGKIVDGAGGPWYYADVGIKGDTIAAIGNLDPKTAARTIDAKGMVVAPGFIDIHTHSRRGIFTDPSAQNYIRQGVTTLMEGNDGSSPIPDRPVSGRRGESSSRAEFRNVRRARVDPQ